MAPTGTLTFYGDRPTFDAAHPGLPVDDFSGHTTPPASLCASSIGPFDDSGNACYAAGNRAARVLHEFDVGGARHPGPPDKRLPG